MSAIAHHWADVVSETALSSFFQSHPWIIPTSQSIHIACVSVVFACAGMISLRLLGVGARGRWMVVSHEAGYFDQNHLVKEFWQLTGNAPSSMGPVSEDWNPSSTLEPNKGVRHFDVQSVIPGAIFQ
jgi:hypothetical protein